MLFIKTTWCFVKRQLQIMMYNFYIKIILKNWLRYVKFVGRRRFVIMLAPLLLFLLVMWPTLWWSMAIRNRAHKPFSKQYPEHKMNRSLEHYLTNIKVLIEPTTPICDTMDEALVVVLVATTTPRFKFREAVRDTWSIHQPTYFIMGGHGDLTKEVVANREESFMFNDLIVFDFYDHNLNETLKTALMMKWSMEQCPQAQFLFKTEDDVMVNPWILNKLLRQNAKAQLVADYIDMILKRAYHVPIINQEDVYFTYLVAHKGLGLTLTHDRRLSPYKPWFQVACVYWNQASIHSLSPMEMLNAWYYLEDLVIFFKSERNDELCTSFNKWFYVFSDLVLY